MIGIYQSTKVFKHSRKMIYIYNNMTDNFPFLEIINKIVIVVIFTKQQSLFYNCFLLFLTIILLKKYNIFRKLIESYMKN